MRILVTGAQGCIGAWVVKNLLDRGLDVLIYDADPTPARLSLIAPAAQIRKAAVETGRIEDGPRLKAVVKDGGRRKNANPGNRRARLDRRVGG